MTEELDDEKRIVMVPNKWALRKVYFNKDGDPTLHTEPETISEEMIQSIVDEATDNFKQYRSYPKGQMIVPQDSFEYWLIKTTEKALMTLNTRWGQSDD